MSVINTPETNPYSDINPDIPLGDLAREPASAMSTHLDRLSQGTLPEDYTETSTADTKLFEAAHGEVPGLVEETLLKLKSNGVQSIETLAQSPDLIHKLPEFLTQQERIVVYDLVLSAIHKDEVHRQYIGESIAQRTYPEVSNEEHVYRLAVNTLRNFAYDVPADAGPERLQVRDDALEILQRLQDEATKSVQQPELSAYQQTDYEDPRRAERIPFDQMKEILNLTGEEQFIAFRDWVDQLRHIGEDAPPLNIHTGAKRTKSDRQSKLFYRFLPERLEFVKDLGEACLENGSVISVEVFCSSLDNSLSPVPYIGLNIKLRGNKGEVYDAVVLERPERVEKRNLETGQVSVGTDDATYLFVTEVPDIWQLVFYQNAQKQAARHEGAARRYHTSQHAENVLASLDDMMDGIRSGTLPFPHTNPYNR